MPSLRSAGASVLENADVLTELNVSFWIAGKPEVDTFVAIIIKRRHTTVHECSQPSPPSTSFGHDRMLGGHPIYDGNWYFAGDPPYAARELCEVLGLAGRPDGLAHAHIRTLGVALVCGDDRINVEATAKASVLDGLPLSPDERRRDHLHGEAPTADQP
jgi:hypothetical protein